MTDKKMMAVMGLSLFFGITTLVRAETVEADLGDWEAKVPEAQSAAMGYDSGQSRLFWYINGLNEGTVKVPKEGEYTVTINASCDVAKELKAKFKFFVDGKQVGEETTLKSDTADDYAFKVTLKAGKVKLGIEFTNDTYKEGEYDLNLYVHGITLKLK